jgi:hypothetical protein
MGLTGSIFSRFNGLTLLEKPLKRLHLILLAMHRAQPGVNETGEQLRLDGVA